MLKSTKTILEWLVGSWRIIKISASRAEIYSFQLKDGDDKNTYQSDSSLSLLAFAHTIR